MNIFQFSFGDGYAGSSKVALQSSRILMQNGFGVYLFVTKDSLTEKRAVDEGISIHSFNTCLLYTSPSPRDRTRSRMPSSA